MYSKKVDQVSAQARSSSQTASSSDNISKKDTVQVANSNNAFSLSKRTNFNNFCYRHDPNITCNKKTDESRMTQIQNAMDNLPLNDQKAINNIWSIFASTSAEQRNLIFKGLLSQCCFPQLSFIASEVQDLIKIDFIAAFPTEVSLKILCYLDCASLCNAAQVSRTWKRLADDDRVWHHLCAQHIDRKCPNCGWGLPLLQMLRMREIVDDTSSSNSTSSNGKHLKDLIFSPNSTQRRLTSHQHSTSSSNSAANDQSKKRSFEQSNQEHASSTNSIVPDNTVIKKQRKTRPWKAVYSERFQVERNWRKGIYKLKEFKGHHTDGILCLQFNHKTLMTGSHDGTVKIWDIENPSKTPKTLAGHTMGVKSLVFDENKVITASLDSTIKIWNCKTAQCISTYRGHSDAVLCVDVHGKIIVSGSADKTIKVWNVINRTCFTLRGHSDWVNCVKIDPKSNTLISCSDDCTIRVWDLNTNQCVKVLDNSNNNNGHVSQIQTVLPITVKDALVEDEEANSDSEDESRDSHNNRRIIRSDISNNIVPHIMENESLETTTGTTTAINNQIVPPIHRTPPRTNNNGIVSFDQLNTIHPDSQPKQDPLDSVTNLPTHIISAGLDNQIKIWNLKTGKCVRTQFGHIEGVWSIAADSFRIVSGAHDKLVKVWDLQSGKCLHTFGGHNSSVNCVGISDSKFAGGDDSGIVRMYCFDNM